MVYGKAAAALATVGLLASTTPSLAMTGIGCPDLPEYYRAVGTIQNGPGSCGMSLEEAKRILARGPNGEGVAAQQAAPAPRAPRKHRHRHKKPHM